MLENRLMLLISIAEKNVIYIGLIITTISGAGEGAPVLTL